MRTIAAYLTSLALCLLWIITGGGISMPAQVIPDPTPAMESIARSTDAEVRMQSANGITPSDLRQNISLFENPAPVRVGTPERTTSVVRINPLSGGMAASEAGFKFLPQDQSCYKGHSSPVLSRTAAVDYYIYALRKILI